MYVQADAPVYAYQGIAGGGAANQSMFFVPPLKCSSIGNVNNIDIDRNIIWMGTSNGLLKFKWTREQ